MKTRHSTASIVLALMIGSLLAVFASCRKSPETIGNNLISDNNYIGVYYTDTVEIRCHSFFEDSVKTKNVTYALLGATKDPVFGTSEAGFYTQFRMSLAGQNFGENPVMDSLVLQLSVANYYGDTNVMQTVHVYKLTDSLSDNNQYVSFSEVPHDLVDQADGLQFRPHPRTTTNIVGTDTIKHAIIRIPLRDELGEYLMGLDTTVYTQPDYFKNQFPGLYVTCEPVGQPGAITSISLTDNTYTMLQLYYHAADTPEKPMRYDFYVTTSDVYFNHIDHDYEQGSPEFVDHLINGDTASGQETVYLQTMGGVRTRILFPNLVNWADTLEEGYVVINEAKLILPVAEWSVDSVFTVPSTLVLLGYNADSSTYLLPDYYEGNAYFGGSYNSTTKAVTFRVSEYMQSMIMKEKDNVGLSLGINGASYNAQRMLINGPQATEEQKMRLEVTYSIVKE